MAERIEDERLVKLRESGANIYSISRLNCMNQCAYQAYLNYVAHVPQESNCWAVLGGRIHDALQSCVDDGADEKCVLEAIDDELESLQMVYGLDFPLDRNGGTSIRDNWVANMTGFAKAFKTPKGTFETEQLILYKVGDNDWMQGYIDLIRYNKDGTLSIYDWKTSSQFTKDHLTEAGRQLCLYAMAKEAEGAKVDRVAWVMMKYCIIKWSQTLKNGSVKAKEKVCEWRNLAKELRGPVEDALIAAGYDEIDTEAILYKLKTSNSLAVLPEEIANKFKVSIYVREYDLTPDVREECLEYIKKTIAEYQDKGNDEDNFAPCDIAKNSFFCQSLCGYGGKTGKCKYWMDYCARFQKDDEEEDDIF